MEIFILILIILCIYRAISNKKELIQSGFKSYKNLEAKKSELEKELRELEDTYKINKKDYLKFKEETKMQVIKEKSEEINEQIKLLSEKETSLSNKVFDLENKFKKLNAIDFGVVPTDFEFEKSETYKEKLKNIKLKESELLRKIKSNKSTEVTINLDKLNRLLYNAFNTFCDYNLSRLTFKSYPTRQNQIHTNYNKLNRLVKGVTSIDEKLLDLKLEELESSYAYYKLKEEEKEALRIQREEEAENKRAQKELERKQAKLYKEIEALNIAKDKVNDKLLAAKDDEIEALRLELQKLEKEISGLQDEKTDIDYRVENTGAGYVYIISNIGSFGEEVYKIGVTRRLDPYQRIQELSSASVPFKFDVHAMIFSYQAYQLETELHRYFDSKRLNKVNNRKEFFNIKLEDIKKVLDLHKELTFDFNPDFEAEEYWATLKMIESDEEKETN
ncbi:GIY-YIG nuclease family protein [Anaerococcus vaginimassiliensis]|uniref:GIY-YIG nuclease family protein n=1 Tax=Anaerococcus vaginimassiliensis TaxID=2042308 RepID=UPI0010315C07|nr:GIY-YIG nuclease family protein [Anaerococcus vaginimassiliensis]